MSARGRGHGRSNRTAMKSSQDGSKKMKHHPQKKTIGDYQYYIGSSKQASDYETTTAYLINHIQKTFAYGKDIAKALENLTPYDMTKHQPVIRVSKSQDPQQREAEEKIYDLQAKAEVEMFHKRQEALELNMSKAYAFLWEQCTKGMKNKIESRTDFLDKIKDDPIELLKVIKVHAMHYQEHRYETAITVDALRVLVNLKQKDNESLQDYTRRFRIANDIFVSHSGVESPFEYVRCMQGLEGFLESDTTIVKTCRHKAYQQFLAYLYIDNADKAKYGSLLTGLQSQFSLGNNQYPTTLIEANNVLSEHRFDPAVHRKQVKSNEEKNDTQDPLTLSFAQFEDRCYCCGKKGHKSPACREKNKPKEEWVVNKITKIREQALLNAAGSANTSVTQGDATSVTTSNTSITSNQERADNIMWSGAHLNVQFYQASQLRDVILLDSESSTSIFCNPKLVTDIHETNEELELLTNGGPLKTKLL